MKKTVLSVFLLSCGYYLLAQSAWTAEKCLELKNITAVTASPDGSKVLYAVREAVMTADRSEYINQIWMTDIKTGKQMPLTRGDKNSAQPAWSPDGQWISFVSNRDGKNNLYLLPVAGGEAEKITDVKSGIGNYKWSPDGRSLACVIADPVTGEDEKNTKGKEDWYYMDEKIKQNRLYVLKLDQKDSAGARVMKKLTEQDLNVNAFDWSPDGKQIIFSHGKSPEVNDNVYSDISLINLEDGKIKSIANSGAGESNPLFSPDGKYLAYASTTDPVDWSGPEHIRIYSLADGKTWKLKATPDENASLIGWTADSRSLLVNESNKTMSSVYILSVDGSSAKEWNAGSRMHLSAANLNKTGGHLAFVLQNASTLPQVYLSTIHEYKPILVSNINEAWKSKTLPRTEVIRWKSKDGKEIEGLLTYPVNYQAGQKVPFILNVHGGPAGVFQQTCIASNQAVYPLAGLAEKGFAILRPNPRGSSGYGADFRMANRKDWGGMDYEDLMDGVDEVIRIGVADTSRMGVMGWSYGGFMSSWIVGHTNRFKAASIGAPVVDLAHQNLTDDIEGFLPSYFKADPWNDWSLYDKHSPLRFVQNVNTPVLLQHGEADKRVPFSNAVMFYNALRRREVPVRLLALPRQPHGPQEPKMVLKTLQSNAEWFDEYLMNKKS
ncbi:MAG TPA: S9 family peptidase [Saprospiraceae bacterium]|nr:S9 family peptidase [Saprospiraceae bacterium]HNT21562.1 S9 family peptidase [Saprospiraceae bacterium]